ncbi:inositol 2-dehydrogenase [Pseudovibrio sp. Ad37]|uniref:inositol 2-dehydrogenase n=1 Tax=Pseudovibrio sp. Ad37 TaxID=989422 RepID=UPI0007AED041|nr:inositol 2-dehydrogenase [Pseudovibrio sp. Ad37]KZL26965.1 Inositol 2-dehydrogenase [Pseudovibrio sp. Ad37]
MTVSIGLLGAGRIGKTHAKAVSQLENAKLAAVFDPFEDAAKEIAAQTGARVDGLDAIMNDPAIDAVIIATPTDLHAEQIEQAARAGKAIFCEKPIHLDGDRVRECLKVVEETGAKLMVGFNRRFDPNFAEVKRQIEAGVIGDVEMVQITSRDPSPPPVDYVKRSGGLFKDMMIHDFDMARFLLGEEVVEVNAMGSAIVSEEIGAAGDVDTATATLKTASGKICTITNSRRATYGYDQRVEVHCSKGMVSAENMRTTTVTVANGDGYTAEPLMDFFMERYEAAYRIELAAFVDALTSGTEISPNGFDGLKALELAEAATEEVAKARDLANA